MKQRSPLAVFFLSLITLGIYAIVWEVKTKNELNSRGADIPTAWLIIIPFANLWWAWKYAEGVEKVTSGKISAVMTLILVVLLGIVGFAILQSEYNKLTLAPASSTPPTPPAPAAPTAPTEPTPPVEPAAPTPTASV